MGNEKKLNRVYVVETIDRMEFFPNQKAAEQRACVLIQESIDDQSTLDVSDEEDSKIAFKINEMISKENYTGALKVFNDWVSEDRYGDFKMIVEGIELEPSPEKPQVFKKDFFTGLPDPEQEELEEWQAQVSNRKTKLGFEAWKKEQAA